MSSKERKERLKEEVHKKILESAMSIIKNEGCESLSIRKIADIIEYSPPIIYSYFLNKEAVLIELSKRGYSMLIDKIKQELLLMTDPKDKMETMLTAYVDFATKENELYHLMYIVGTGVADVEKTFPGHAAFINLFREGIQLLVKESPITEDTFRCNYLICISFVHGLVAVNRYYKDIEPAMNDTVLKKAIRGIVSTIELNDQSAA